MPRDIAKGLQAGFFSYLTKPIKINEFMDVLDAALEHAEKISVRKLAEGGGDAVPRPRERRLSRR